MSEATDLAFALIQLAADPAGTGERLKKLAGAQEKHDAALKKAKDYHDRAETNLDLAHERTQVAERKELANAARSKQLDQLADSLAERERGIVERENTILPKEQELANRKADLASKVSRWEKEHEARETDYVKRKARLDTDRKELDERIARAKQFLGG